MMSWRDVVVEALESLGGQGSLDSIYKQIAKHNRRTRTKAWQATVRNTIESASSDSDNYRETAPDLFYSVGGKGSGTWGLRRTRR